MRILRRWHGIAVRATAVVILRCIRTIQEKAKAGGPVCIRLKLSGPLHFFIPHVYYFIIVKR